MNRIIASALAGVLTLGLVVGCTTPASEVPKPVDTTPEESTPEVVLPELPEGATARGVVLAGVLLTSGDITRAAEEGLVTPEEIELARQALEEGTLQAWADLAAESGTQ